MTPRTRKKEEPGLFDDLPLRSDDSGLAPPTATRSSPTPPAKEPQALSLFTESPEDATPASPAVESTGASASHPSWRPPIPVQAQISASLLDLAMLLGVALVIWLGLETLGVELRGASVGFLALFFLPFSFLYQVFPLAFWGRTPGMARVGLVARGRDGQTLTFSQAGLRWIASVLTVLLVGLPLLATQVTGRSLADRISGSQTLPAR